MQVLKYIDYFRMAAAILVVAIHTSPLLSFNETGDFILTRIAARIAVPFFFMVSGFLLFGRNAEGRERNGEKKRIYEFLIRTLKLYIIAIVLYLPLNIYMGYFNKEFIFINLIKDIFINGTIYHLWYLPAAITGAVLTWVCINRLGYKKAFIVTLGLYLIGIFGDSYYKSIAAIPRGQDFYKFLFQFFDYTRNGLFFAPLFFIMGGLAGKRKSVLKPRLLWILFMGSMAFMLVEGLLLRHFKIQRHDSMYFMLIPTMYFLFQLLISEEGKGNLRRKTNNTKPFRKISMVIYLIHPWVIVGIRMIAKAAGLTDIFVTNSMLHFICVLTGSILTGILYTYISPKKILKNLSDKKCKEVSEIKN